MSGIGKALNRLGKDVKEGVLVGSLAGLMAIGIPMALNAGGLELPGVMGLALKCLADQPLGSFLLIGGISASAIIVGPAWKRTLDPLL